MALALNFGIEDDVFGANAPLFKEIHFTQVRHSVSAVHARIVRDGYELAFGLSTVAGAGGHELRAERHVGALGAERVVVGGEVGSAHRPDLGVVEPAHQFGHPVQGGHGVVVGEEHEVVVHLAQRKVAGVGTVAGRVVNPRGAVLFADRLGVVFGFGISDDELKMRIGLLAEALEDDVEFVGVVDGGDQHGRFVRRAVFFEQNGDRLTFAHGTGDTPAS